MTLARFAALLTVALTATFGLAACGHHHHDDHGHNDGTLEVHNDELSVFFVDSVEIEELDGPDHFDIVTDLDAGESFFIDLFPATYDVTIFWSDGSSELHTVDVFEDFVTTLTVQNLGP